MDSLSAVIALLEFAHRGLQAASHLLGRFRRSVGGTLGRDPSERDDSGRSRGGSRDSDERA